MDKTATGEQPAIDDRRLTRRQILRGAALGFAALVLAPVARVFLGVPGQNQPQMMTGNVLDSALAGQGHDIVGNAVGNYPQAAIHAAQLATAVMIVRFAGDEYASLGTTWKMDTSADPSGNIICPTAMHVLTMHNQHHASDISEVWIGRPRSKEGFAVLRAADVTLVVPAGYNSENPADDVGLVCIPQHAAPDWLAAAPGLKLAPPDANHAGEPLMVSGVPASLMPEATTVGLEATPLYMGVMPLASRAPVPGCFGIKGSVAQGASGSSVVNRNGEVVGLATAWKQDSDTVVAVPANSIAQLAQAR